MLILEPVKRFRVKHSSNGLTVGCDQSCHFSNIRIICLYTRT